MLIGNMIGQKLSKSPTGNGSYCQGGLGSTGKRLGSVGEEILLWEILHLIGNARNINQHFKVRKAM